HDGQLVADRDRRQRPHHRAAAVILHAQADREQPAHGWIRAVIGAQRGHRKQQCQSVHRPAQFGKQYESDDASPPSSRTWWGRSPPSGNSTKKSGSIRKSPPGSESNLTSQPLMPSG